MPSSGAAPQSGRNRTAVSALARLKITDPDEGLPEAAPGTELRVLLPEDDRFAILAEKLEGMGAQVRRVRYPLEDEPSRQPSALRIAASCSPAAASAG